MPWFEEDADSPSHWLLLWACLHSKPCLYAAARLQLALLSSVEFLSPDFLAVIMASGLQGETYTLFGATSRSWQATEVIMRLVLFFFVFLSKPGQVFVFAEACYFPLLLICSLLCADSQESSGLLPCLPPETMRSLQSEVHGFSQNRDYRRQDVFMLRSPLLPTAKLESDRQALVALRAANIHLKQQQQQVHQGQ